jgi:hypothetical protein
MSKRSASGTKQPAQECREPTLAQKRRVTEDIIEKLLKYGAGPEHIYAFRTTGVNTSRPQNYSREEFRAWCNAIIEYYERAREAAQGPRN